MRYVHDGKELKTNQSIGVEKLDDNTYCFVYAYIILCKKTALLYAVRMNCLITKILCF